VGDSFEERFEQGIAYVLAVEAEKFANLSKPEQQQRKDALEKIANHLKRVTLPERVDEVSDWSGILFGAAISEAGYKASWFRKSGSVHATTKLRDLIVLMTEMKSQIEALPLEAMEALYAIVKANDERSIAIAANEINLALLEESELESDLFEVILRMPICSWEAARADRRVVLESRRIACVRELSETVLPRLISAAEEAARQLRQKPTQAGRPPDRQKANLAKRAEEAYESLSGEPANRTANDRKVPTFAEFLDGLFPLLGVHSEYVRETAEGKTVRGRGGKSQTKKLRKGRTGSKKGR
jgi:hypothetical protein